MNKKGVEDTICKQMISMLWQRHIQTKLVRKKHEIIATRECAQGGSYLHGVKPCGEDLLEDKSKKALPHLSLSQSTVGIHGVAPKTKLSSSLDIVSILY